MGIMEGGGLIAKHDVISTGHAHDVVHSRDAEQGEQSIGVILIGSGVIGIANVAAHRETEELAAKMVLQPGADDLLCVSKIFRADKTHDGVYEQRREGAGHGGSASFE